MDQFLKLFGKDFSHHHKNASTINCKCSLNKQKILMSAKKVIKKFQIETIKIKNLAIKRKILPDRSRTEVDITENRTNGLEDEPIEFSYLSNQKKI